MVRKGDTATAFLEEGRDIDDGMPLFSLRKPPGSLGTTPGSKAMGSVVIDKFDYEAKGGPGDPQAVAAKHLKILRALFEQLATKDPNDPFRIVQTPIIRKAFEAKYDNKDAGRQAWSRAIKDLDKINLAKDGGGDEFICGL